VKIEDLCRSFLTFYHFIACGFCVEEALTNFVHQNQKSDDSIYSVPLCATSAILEWTTHARQTRQKCASHACDTRVSHADALHPVGEVSFSAWVTFGQYSTLFTHFRIIKIFQFNAIPQIFLETIPVISPSCTQCPRANEMSHLYYW
jgi:hypothetical protein